MHRAKQVITVLMGIIGVLLIARGVWGGVLPISIQLIIGVALLAYAVIRRRYAL